MSVQIQRSPLLSVEVNSNDKLMQELTMLMLQQQKTSAVGLNAVPLWLTHKASTIPVVRAFSTCLCCRTLVLVLQCETIQLHGQPIGAFMVSGEYRVCVPQLVAVVLTSVTLDEINRALLTLQIHTQLADIGINSA